MSDEPTTSEILGQITERIVAALRDDVLPWRRPWRGSGMPLRHGGLPFTGTNALILSLAADERGYESPYWLTEAQGRRYRASVRKGEKGTRVLRPIFLQRQLIQSHEVFNAEQFDRLPPRFRPDRNRATGAGIVPGGDRDAHGYAALMREAIHWTGHASRVRRELGEWFGDEERAGEKLVAELSAAYLTARLSLPHQCDDAHAPYVDSWIRLLERDERAIHIAATRAQRVADYLVVATGSERVEELATRPLDDRAWIVVYLDVVEIGSHLLAVAVGVDGNGAKRVLGMCLVGSEPDEPRPAVEGLLRDLVGRGLSLRRRPLFVTDGSALLRDTVTKVFGWETAVQACRLHVKREVLAHLPGAKARDAATKVFARAWKPPKAASRVANDGQRLLAGLADDFERDGHQAAAGHLRDRLRDLFTVDRFRLHPRLRRSLTTTSLIDQARSGLPRQVCDAANWPDPQMALRWAAASFLATEQGYLKIGGHRHLQFLKDHLDQIEMPFGP